MDIIDISWPITQDMTEYKDRKTVIFKPVKLFEKDGVREYEITCNSHTGTHIDSPSHFLKNGKAVDNVLLSSCIGRCKVLDLTSITKGIARSDLQVFDISEGEIVIFKTKNSFLSPVESFDYNFVFLQEDGAQYLVEKRVKAVGIDYLGLERDQKGHPSHICLMEHDVTIIEGLRLETVVPGEYFFCCLPIYFVGIESALCRAVLMNLVQLKRAI